MVSIRVVEREVQYSTVYSLNYDSYQVSSKLSVSVS